MEKNTKTTANQTAAKRRALVESAGTRAAAFPAAADDGACALAIDNGAGPDHGPDRPWRKAYPWPHPRNHHDQKEIGPPQMLGTHRIALEMFVDQEKTQESWIAP